MKLKKWANQKIAYKKVRTFINRNSLYLVIASAIFLALIYFSGYFRQILVMIFFILLGFLSMLYYRYIRISLGLELNTLGTVITAILYGPIVGSIVGISAFLLAMMFNEHLFKGSIVSITGIAVMAVLASLLSGMNLFFLGVLLTVIYDVLIAVGYYLLGSNPGRIILFVATHLPFNVWVFAVLAPRVLEVARFFQ